MDEYVHFLNLEYFVLHAYQLVLGFNGGSGSVTGGTLAQIPSGVIYIIQGIAWAGIALSLLFLALVVYARRRLHAIEHEGWHERDEEMEALRKRHDTSSPVNPRFEHVLMLAGGPTESDWRRAIVEADIMLDDLLTQRGYVGSSIGDKLKTANPLQFSTLDSAWRAHRVRNDITHGGERFRLTSHETRATIEQYRRVFEEFNYL